MRMRMRKIMREKIIMVRDEREDTETEKIDDREERQNYRDKR